MVEQTTAAVSTSGTETRDLAALAGRIVYSGAPADVQRRTLEVIVDTVCAIGLGAQNDQVRGLLGAMVDRTEGPASIIGTTRSSSSSDACFLNGSAAAVQSLDEGHRLARGHAAIHVVPAVLAAAEHGDFSGEDVCGAVLAGYEVAVRVSLAMGPLSPPVHPHGNWGAIGAAAGVTHLLTRRDPAALAAAIDAASACAFSGYMQTALDGADVHFLFAGFGAQTGLTTGTAASLGWTVTEGALRDFFMLRSSGRAGDPGDTDDATTDPDDPISYEIMNNYFKRFSTCGHIQSTNDAIDNLITTAEIDAGSIETIEVATYDVASAMSRHVVASPLAAGFSIPVTVAVALLHGSSAIYDIGEELLQDPAVQRLARKVTVVADPDLSPRYPAGRPSRVTITFSDGRKLEEQVSMALGDSELPLSRKRLEDKWRLQLSSFVHDGCEAAVADALLDLPNRQTAEVMAVLRDATR